MVMSFIKFYSSCDETCHERLSYFRHSMHRSLVLATTVKYTCNYQTLYKITLVCLTYELYPANTREFAHGSPMSSKITRVDHENMKLDCRKS